MKTLKASLVVAAVALATSGCMTHPERMAAERCDWPSPAVATAEGTTPTHLFAGIDTTWTLARIFARLGPARAETGDLTYQWQADDGRTYVASASSRCGLVYRAGFVETRPGP